MLLEKKPVLLAYQCSVSPDRLVLFPLRNGARGRRSYSESSGHNLVAEHQFWRVLYLPDSRSDLATSDDQSCRVRTAADSMCAGLRKQVKQGNAAAFHPCFYEAWRISGKGIGIAAHGYTSTSRYSSASAILIHVPEPFAWRIQNGVKRSLESKVSSLFVSHPAFKPGADISRIA